jgi:gamma-glutamylcyclotransferase (GGCT)/AIG2-like uncharacterized protein YtfP
MNDCRYYFAYGSNMNRNRMKERKVNYLRANLALVRGYKLSFDKEASGIRGGGYANLTATASANDIVYGVVYELASASELEKLDVFEGVEKNNYYRQRLSLTLLPSQSKNDDNTMGNDSNSSQSELSKNNCESRYSCRSLATDFVSLEAIAYLACPKRVHPNLRPPKEYLGHLLSAQELPDDYRARLAKTETVD